MQHISAESLEDLPSRISYLSSFLNLTEEDGEALLAAKPLVAPLVPAVLELVYSKLLSYDITAAKFVPKNSGFEGQTVNSVAELTLESDIIKYRKDFLKNYLVKLVSTTDLTPASPFWVYLNNVGIMHTGQPGFKYRAKRPELRVEFIHMSALLGYVVDIFIGAVMGMSEEDVSTEMKSRVLRALNKVIWIQNDLFARHYIRNVDGPESQVAPCGEDAKVVDQRRDGVGCPFATNGIHAASL